jgi:hypothetical protein
MTAAVSLLLLLMLYSLSKLHNRPNSCRASMLLTSPAAARGATKGPLVARKVSVWQLKLPKRAVTDCNILLVSAELQDESPGLLDGDAAAAAAADLSAATRRTQSCSSLQH